jgi:hypothetical protein
MASAGDDLYSFKNGKLWQHNVADSGANMFYGKRNPSDISVAVNGGDTKIKGWLTASVEGSHAPVKTFFKDGMNRESGLVKKHYEKRDGVFYASILRSGEGVKQFNGERLRGAFMMMLNRFNERGKIQIKAFNVGFKKSVGHETI